MSKRQVYTLRPLTREQWAALDSRNRYRARIHLTEGEPACGMYRPDRTAAEADLAELLPAITEMRQRYPYMAQVTGGDIEDRGAANLGGCVVEYRESPDSAPLKDAILAALFPGDPPAAVSS